jgi:hypothetical protein
MTAPPSGRVNSVDQSVRVQRGVSWVGGRHVERQVTIAMHYIRRLAFISHFLTGLKVQHLPLCATLR